MKVILLISLLTFPPPQLAQLAGGQHSHRLQKTVTRRVSGNYVLYLPQGYGKTGERFPLIMYLHGGSLRGGDVEKLRTMGLPRLLEDDKLFPFIVVSPLCPAGEIWTETDLLIGILDEVTSRYQVDAQRVYLTGHSMGGRGTWYLAYKFPERFAAIAPMSAVSTITAWASRLQNTPAWVIHGAKDDIVPLKESEAMVDALKSSGAHVKFSILPDRDHFILDAYENKQLYEWFLQHRRNPSSQGQAAPPASGRKRPD